MTPGLAQALVRMEAPTEQTSDAVCGSMCTPVQMGSSAQAVLQRCQDVAESLGALAAASSAADAAQARKEQLHE